jgi:hypothetical protein
MFEVLVYCQEIWMNCGIKRGTNPLVSGAWQLRYQGSNGKLNEKKLNVYVYAIVLRSL